MHLKLAASQPLVPHIAVPESGVLLKTHRCIDKSHSCLTGVQDTGMGSPIRQCIMDLVHDRGEACRGLEGQLAPILISVSLKVAAVHST